MPTLCIDETATAGQSRTLFHLLRSGTSRHVAAFREGQSYRAYGAKAITWNQLPDDEALNSRCLIIPMQESSCRPSLRTTDPELIRHADALQGSLLRYRLEHHRKLVLARVPGEERLRSRARDLYEALALPFDGDLELCACLLECFEQQELNREPLTQKQVAVLESFFKQIHFQPNEENYALRPLKDEANSWLATAGERFRLNEKAVSAVLKPFGFINRKRMNSGVVVVVDRAARKRIHDLLSRYGLSDLSAPPPAQALSAPCEFCRDLKRAEGSENSSPGSRAPGAFLRSKAWEEADEEVLEEARRDYWETAREAFRDTFPLLDENGTWGPESQDMEDTPPGNAGIGSAGEAVQEAAGHKAGQAEPSTDSRSNGRLPGEHDQPQCRAGEKSPPAVRSPGQLSKNPKPKDGEVASVQGLADGTPPGTGALNRSGSNGRKYASREFGPMRPRLESWYTPEPGDAASAEGIFESVERHEREQQKREEPKQGPLDDDPAKCRKTVRSRNSASEEEVVHRDDSEEEGEAEEPL